jgi:hypothetical protein
MEIKPPTAVITPPSTGRRERTLPVEGGALELPLEGETDFARVFAEELATVQRAAAHAQSAGHLIDRAKAELEQSARHLIRAHQFLDLAKKGTERA